MIKKKSSFIIIKVWTSNLQNIFRNFHLSIIGVNFPDEVCFGWQESKQIFTQTFVMFWLLFYISLWPFYKNIIR